MLLSYVIAFVLFFVYVAFYYDDGTITYSPEICTITNYKFTFIYDQNETRFKVHGIWPDGCEECLNCAYPSCCNIQNIIYNDPYDPNNFINKNWFQTQTSDGCNVKQNKVSLFEHEYYKHISCTNIKTTTDFLNLAESLYEKYYETYVVGFCNKKNEIWINLDKNFDYVDYECH